MQRTATAHWSGGLKDGKGTVSTQSGVLNQTQYSFSTRFENGVGTNPEELIAAAHAGCFSMALSAQLGNAGMTAESIDTKATLTLDKTDAGFTITRCTSTLRSKSRARTRPSSTRPLKMPKRDARFPGFSTPNHHGRETCFLNLTAVGNWRACSASVRASLHVPGDCAEILWTRCFKVLRRVNERIPVTKDCFTERRLVLLMVCFAVALPLFAQNKMSNVCPSRPPF